MNKRITQIVLSGLLTGVVGCGCLHNKQGIHGTYHTVIDPGRFTADIHYPISGATTATAIFHRDKKQMELRYNLGATEVVETWEISGGYFNSTITCD